MEVVCAWEPLLLERDHEERGKDQSYTVDLVN